MIKLKNKFFILFFFLVAAVVAPAPMMTQQEYHQLTHHPLRTHIKIKSLHSQAEPN